MSHKNILAVYQLASAAEVVEGRSWYARACSVAIHLANRYGVSHMQATGVIAALSPRNRWERNVLDAENLIQAYTRGGAEVASLVRVCTFNSNKAKAIRFLAEVPCTDADALAILSGPKLKEFYSCISGIRNVVCIDGHAYSTWTGGRITLNAFGALSKKTRQEVNDDYVKADVEVGIRSVYMPAITMRWWCPHYGVVSESVFVVNYTCTSVDHQIYPM